MTATADKSSGVRPFVGSSSNQLTSETSADVHGIVEFPNK
jgi:hypothetical protein